MKKTAERILILTLFLICLIMLFLVCTPAIKAEPFIRTYDLIQDGEISKSFDGTGELKVKTIDVSDTITADTITAARLNIINIDITTLSGTSAILNSIIVSDTADITDLTADTITANKIVSETLNEYIKKTDSIYSDSIVSLALTKIIGDTITKTEVNDSLDLKLNISDSIVITKISELENDSNFISLSDLPDTNYIDNHIDSGDIHFTQENISISQTQINDSIPYTRVSSVPDFALRAELGIDTASADIRYLSINADTMNADWNKIINKPFIPDTSVYTHTTVLNDSFNIKADTPHIHNISDVVNLTESLTVKLSNTDTSIIRDMAGTVNYETEVAEIYKAMVNISDTKMREIGDSVAVLDSSVLILSDSITLLENRVNAVEDSIPNRVSQLQNDSNFASYNDTLFFQVSNSDTIYADTSITADTQMDIINDTACFVIYGDSYGVDLKDFEFAYKIKINGVWLESSQLVYFDEANKRVVFKADINTFTPNTIKFSFWRVKK